MMLTRSEIVKQNVEEFHPNRELYNTSINHFAIRFDPVEILHTVLMKNLV